MAVGLFYNMSKRRGEQRNWYALAYDERRKLMRPCERWTRVRRQVKQLITGSTVSTTQNGA